MIGQIGRETFQEGYLLTDTDQDRIAILPGDDDAVRRYNRLTSRIEGQNLKTWLLWLLLLCVDLAFTAWGYFLWAKYQGSCNKPLRTILLLTTIVFTVSSLLLILSLIFLKLAFWRFVYSNTSLRGPERREYAIVPSDPAVADAQGDEESLDGRSASATIRASDVVIDSAREKKTATIISDSIFVIACSCGFLICAALILMCLMIILMVWLYSNQSNCVDTVPSFTNYRPFAIGCVVVFALNVVWFIFACQLCPFVWDVYNVEQQMMLLADSQTNVRAVTTGNQRHQNLHPGQN